MRYQVVTPLPIFPYGMLLQGKLYLGLTVGGAETKPDSLHNSRKIEHQKEGHEEQRFVWCANMNENGSNASDVRKRQAVYVLLHIEAIRVTIGSVEKQ